MGPDSSKFSYTSAHRKPQRNNVEELLKLKGKKNTRLRPQGSNVGTDLKPEGNKAGIFLNPQRNK